VEEIPHRIVEPRGHGPGSPDQAQFDEKYFSVAQKGLWDGQEGISRLKEGLGATGQESVAEQQPQSGQCDLNRLRLGIGSPESF